MKKKVVSLGVLRELKKSILCLELIIIELAKIFEGSSWNRAMTKKKSLYMSTGF